jgi:fatty acyl-CoA reductase
MVFCTVAVTCAWKEPIPGWTNSKNGPAGFMMGAAKGIVRRLPVNKNLIYDYIPVDIVINELIVAAWHVGTTRYAKFTLLTNILYFYIVF